MILACLERERDGPRNHCSFPRNASARNSCADCRFGFGVSPNGLVKKNGTSRTTRAARAPTNREIRSLQGPHAHGTRTARLARVSLGALRGLVVASAVALSACSAVANEPVGDQRGCVITSNPDGLSGAVSCDSSRPSASPWLSSGPSRGAAPQRDDDSEDDDREDDD